jgi:hypothetical protein
MPEKYKLPEGATSSNIEEKVCVTITPNDEGGASEYKVYGTLETFGFNADNGHFGYRLRGDAGITQVSLSVETVTIIKI